MKVYIVFYNHTFFNTNEISAVFIGKRINEGRAKAESYCKEKRENNECVYATWEIFEQEVTE